MHTFLDCTITTFSHTRVLVCVVDAEFANGALRLEVCGKRLVQIFSPSIRVKDHQFLSQLPFDLCFELQIGAKGFILGAQKIEKGEACHIIDECNPIPLSSP